MDASNFSGMVDTHKHFTCMVEVEGEIAFLSSGFAVLRPPWTSSGPLLGPLLGWSQRWQGRDAQVRCGAADGLAQLRWRKLEKDAKHGPVGHAIPHLPSPASSAYPFQQ